MAAVKVPHPPMALVHSIPTNAGYSVLLLLHVGSAVLGFGAIVVTGIQARWARQGPNGPRAAGVRRYFRPGVNWAARTLYLVPVFGFALLADSGGDFRAGDGFVTAGLLLWLVAALAAEAVVWPGERRIQAVISADWRGPGAADCERDCRRVFSASVVLGAVFLAAFVLMIARP